MKTFGQFVKERREAMGKELRDIAHAADLPAGVLYRYCHNVQPKRNVCRRLAKPLEVSEDEVLIMAGHIPEDVMEILQSDPDYACGLLRRVMGVPQ